MENNYQFQSMKKITPLTIGTVLLFVGLFVFAILVLSSVIYVPGNEVGIVEKKLFGGDLPADRILAVNGENGIQAAVLAPGWHVKWKWMYNVDKVKWTQIKEGYVGLVTAKDGKSLPQGSVYAPEWVDTDKMASDAEFFLSEGNGYKGPQLSVLHIYIVDTRCVCLHSPCRLRRVRPGTRNC